MKDLRDRCEKLAKILIRQFPFNGEIDAIESFAREIRNDALEEAIGLADKMAQFRKGHDEEMDMINAGGTITAGVIAAKLRAMKRGTNALAAKGNTE